MQHNEFIYLSHMLDIAIKAREKVEQFDRDYFECDEIFRLTLVYLLQTIGEEGRHISKETQQLYPQILWSQIIGMRHKVVQTIWVLITIWFGTLSLSICYHLLKT